MLSGIYVRIMIFTKPFYSSSNDVIKGIQVDIGHDDITGYKYIEVNMQLIIVLFCIVKLECH